MKLGSVYTRSEAARKVGLSEQLLSDWIAQRLILPSGVADEDQELFDESDITQLTQMANLHQLGYGTVEIKKIAQKVGLPRPEKLPQKKGKPQKLLTVGELAKRSGLNARTIKYWEERGIIEPTSRSEGGFRLYDQQYVLFCSLIQDLQLFGYTLDQIKEVSELFKTFYAISTGTFDGSEKEILLQLESMKEKIEAFFDRLSEFNKGIERWRKLLKEKQGQIDVYLKRHSKEKGKKTAAAKKAAQVPS